MTNFEESKNRRASSSSPDPTQRIKSDLKAASENAKNATNERLEENRNNVADNVDSVAHAARVAAADLKHQEHTDLSHYINELADTVSSLADTLRHKSVDELIHDASDIARNNPALFIGGSIAIGLGIARFAKSSSHRSDTDRTDYAGAARDEQQRSANQHADQSEESENRANESLITGYTQPNGRGSSIGNSASVQGSNNGMGAMGGTHNG